MITQERLEEWMNGDIDDDDLTKAEVIDLARRVNDAIVRKTLVRQGVHTFPDHRTLQ